MDLGPVEFLGVEFWKSDNLITKDANLLACII